MLPWHQNWKDPIAWMLWAVRLTFETVGSWWDYLGEVTLTQDLETPGLPGELWLFWFSLVWFVQTFSSIGFQVKIQRHRRICSGANRFLSILQTVPVFSQFSTSACLALSNSCRSLSVKVHNFTSVRCFFWLVARNIMVSSCSSLMSLLMSDSGTSTSKSPCQIGIILQMTIVINDLGKAVGRIKVSHLLHRCQAQELSCAGSSSIGVSSTLSSGSWSGCSWEDAGRLIILTCAYVIIRGNGYHWWNHGRVIGIRENWLIRSWFMKVHVVEMDFESYLAPTLMILAACSSSGMSWASAALTGRTCSGAARIRFPWKRQNTWWGPSCWTTLAGPTQVLLCSLSFQTITHSPGAYSPRAGSASVVTWLYARTSDCRPHERLFGLIHAWLVVDETLMPWAWSLVAVKWAGRSSSPVIDAGTRKPFPNTKTSGENPCRRLQAFLAAVHMARATWRSL